MVAPFPDIRFCVGKNESSKSQLRPDNDYCRMKMRCFQELKNCRHSMNNIAERFAQFFAASAFLQELVVIPLVSPMEFSGFERSAGVLW